VNKTKKIKEKFLIGPKNITIKRILEFSKAYRINKKNKSKK